MSRRLRYSAAVDDAIASAMALDPTIIIFGEDVPLLRKELFARFGGGRVMGAPISESAFLGAAVGAAMAGLRPIAEVYMADFLGVCFDSLLNHAAKTEAFSGGRWKVPMVVRAPCGGGYGDGGQHEQCLWGILAHIPGLVVVVPSTPGEAGGLMTAALHYDGPVIFMEHKLLSETSLEFLGAGGRKTVEYDVPREGTEGEVPNRWSAIPLGKARTVREGSDGVLVSLGVGVHRCIEAAERMAGEGQNWSVLDLRTVAPLDIESVAQSALRTGRLIVVDEDYLRFGLTGEIAAVIAERQIVCRFARVATETTIPYARTLEDAALPNTERILKAIRNME